MSKAADYKKADFEYRVAWRTVRTARSTEMAAVRSMARADRAYTQARYRASRVALWIRRFERWHAPKLLLNRLHARAGRAHGAVREAMEHYDASLVKLRLSVGVAQGAEEDRKRKKAAVRALEVKA